MSATDTPEHVAETIRYIHRLVRVVRSEDGTFELHTSHDGLGRTQSGCSLELTLAVIAARWGAKA